MHSRRHPLSLTAALFVLAVSLFVVAPIGARGEPTRWVTAWTTATFAETPGKDTPDLRGSTYRQVVKVTVAGPSIRIRIGNYFGAEPLRVGAGRVALSEGGSREQSGTEHALRFSGQPEISVPPGTAVLSDPVPLPVTSGSILAIDLHIIDLPRTLTVHSAARANSYLFPGDVLALKNEPPPASTFTRWYFLSGVDVANDTATTIAVLGDSITDGYGCSPDSYARWPDVLARRLRDDPATHDIGVLNAGIGGNRLLRDGLGPRALSRLDRDVFSQLGVTTLIVCLGINDIGTRLQARKEAKPFASAAEIIAALQSIVAEGRRHGLKVIGGTLTPYSGATFYWSDDGEQDRQAVNAWIRKPGNFDGVLDFDAVVRDPALPDRLAREYDSGDHLHPSVAGYARMGEFIRPSDLFLHPHPLPLPTRQR